MPIALSEVSKLSKVSQRNLRPDTELARGPARVASDRFSETHAKRDSTNGLTRRASVLERSGHTFRCASSCPLALRLVVLEPPEVLRCGLFDHQGRCLTTWEGPKDELDVFVGSVSHAVSRLISSELNRSPAYLSLPGRNSDPRGGPSRE